MRDEDTILPVSTRLNGQYGIYDVCLSLPCVIGANGIHQVLEIPLDENENAQLQKSARTLRKVLDEIEGHSGRKEARTK